MASEGVRAVRVQPNVTFELRCAVLGRRPTRAELEDEVAGWGHYAVIIDDLVVATGVAAPQSSPGAGDWRILGMAVDDHLRGQGLGGLVLLALLEHIRNNGGASVWCHAREGAVDFYLRYGFQRRSTELQDPVAGVQVLMSRQV